MNPFRTATLFTHRRPAETAPALATLLRLAREAGAVIRLDPEESQKHRLAPAEGLELDAQDLRDVDICFALGGDGTVLTALRRYAGTGVPVFGVNFGEIGFLATVDREQAEEGFRRAFAGQFDVLALPGISMSGDGTQWLAFNDISVHRQPGKRVADLQYAVGADEIGRVRCDGLVVATPAGSTGYNLANGGPVMAWGVEGFVVSFIAPHSLTARALVVAPQDVLVIANRSLEEPVDVAVDGRPVRVLAPADEMEARFSDREGALAQIAGTTFYERLREKFGGWRRRPSVLSRKFGGTERGHWGCRARPQEPMRSSVGEATRTPRGAARGLSTAVQFMTLGTDRPRPGGSVGPAWYTPRMLYELRVENLLLMERAELRFAPGLNVLTGETGAGKTLLAHALDLLLGGRARSGIVRRGASEAYVEGVFARPAGVEAGLEERIPDDADELVLARRVWPDGRTRAYICGRSANLADLRELGSRLLAFYGQHEHRKLMVAAAQLDVLDGYCGPGQLQARAGAGAAYERVSSLRRRVAELGELAGARDRELDLIAFELDEIEAVQPTGEEQETLTAERDRLRHLEALQSATAVGAEALACGSGDDDGGSAAGALVRAVLQLESVAGIDPRLDPLVERLQAVRYEAEDLASELRRYALGLDGAPGRLEEVEERLALFARLERKHGGSVAEVLRHAERCRARRDELAHADVALETAQAELAGAQDELDRLAAELTATRRKAAPALAAAVRERLAELAMADAGFEVELREREDGCGPRGADAVELRIAPNPGVPAGPLREIASGGELSRVMLALLSVAHAASDEDAGDSTSPLLVFDEVDAGIGGHTARAVGNHLRQLAETRQIMCITHLPQVAALAASHFTIEKDTSTLPARTTVTALAGDDVVSELVRMLGAGEGDAAASRHARQLLEAA